MSGRVHTRRHPTGRDNQPRGWVVQKWSKPVTRRRWRNGQAEALEQRRDLIEQTFLRHPVSSFPGGRHQRFYLLLRLLRGIEQDENAYEVRERERAVARRRRQRHARRLHR